MTRRLVSVTDDRLYPSDYLDSAVLRVDENGIQRHDHQENVAQVIKPHPSSMSSVEGV